MSPLACAFLIAAAAPKVIVAAPAEPELVALDDAVTPAAAASETAAPTAAVTATATPVTPTPAQPFQPLGLGIDAALELPVAARFPMASTRIDFRYQVPAGAALVAVGLRSGYSYLAGQGPVEDPRLGADAAAYLLAHQIPLQVVAAVGLRADEAPLVHLPLRASVMGGAGTRFVFGEAHSFGRTASVFAVVPVLTLGGSLELELSNALRVGLLGEYDAARLDLAAAAPGVSGDLSTIRLGLNVTYAWGV